MCGSFHCTEGQREPYDLTQIKIHMTVNSYVYKTKVLEKVSEWLTVLIGVRTVHHDVWLRGGCCCTLRHECTNCFFLQRKTGFTLLVHIAQVSDFIGLL